MKPTEKEAYSTPTLTKQLNLKEITMSKGDGSVSGTVSIISLISQG